MQAVNDIFLEFQSVVQTKIISDGLQHFSFFFRHIITFKQVSGESKVTKEITAPWKETTLPSILTRYQLKDIFNVDKFGLFSEDPPSKSLHFRGKEV